MRGLYIHLPFCLKKCDYCDFTSYTDCYHLEKAYTDALLREFSSLRGMAVDTVYIGGGTPTSLKPESLVRILDGAFSEFQIEKQAEITVECNPKTADEKTFSALLEAGVNRLSIGVQSLDDRVLKTIGRIHSAEDAVTCVEMARSAGFSNISADLMFALPGQNMEMLDRTIDGFLALSLSHISCYGLILEEGTPLFSRVESGKAVLPDEDTEYEMYRKINRRLAENGFSRYEISNFSKPGMESRHNMGYWNCREYAGCGAGAHGYLSGVRFCHTDSLLEYIQNPCLRLEETKVEREDSISEFMMLGLRKTEGVKKSEFFKRFGVTMEEQFGEILAKYQNMGLLSESEDHVCFTEEGVYVSNSVLCEFV